METVLRLKTSDLNLDFLKAVKSLFKKDEEIEMQISSKSGFSVLKAVKSLFKKDEEIEMQISSKSGFSVLKAETQEECNSRIEKSFNNIKKNRNTVSFTGEEFMALTQKLLKK